MSSMVFWTSPWKPPQSTHTLPLTQHQAFPTYLEGIADPIVNPMVPCPLNTSSPVLWTRMEESEISLVAFPSPTAAVDRSIYSPLPRDLLTIVQPVGEERWEKGRKIDISCSSLLLAPSFRYGVSMGFPWFCYLSRLYGYFTSRPAPKGRGYR